MQFQVITTRNYDNRLDTLANVREAGISVCSGGIIGLGEEDTDRVGLIWEMSQLVFPFHTFLTRENQKIPNFLPPPPSLFGRLPEAPESFPVNALVPIPGTPLEGNERVGITEILRCVATARIVLPT